MSKKSTQNSHAAETEILRQSSKSMVLNLRQTLPNGRIKKSCYSISCTYDDKSILEKKITVRDPNIDNFDAHFNNAVKMNSDYVVVTVYEGEGASATELQGSQNIIRVREKQAKQPRNSSNSNLSGPPEVRTETTSDVQLLRLELMNEAAMTKKDNEHQQQLWEKNKVIEKLETEKSELEKENKALESAYGELVKETDDERKDGMLKMHNIGQIGLGALSAFVAGNPNGKLLGMIPNSILAKSLGMAGSTDQLEQSADTTTASARKVYYDVFTDFFESLNDDEFNKVHAIISAMSDDKAVLDLMIAKSNISK